MGEDAPFTAGTIVTKRQGEDRRFSVSSEGETGHRKSHSTGDPGELRSPRGSGRTHGSEPGFSGSRLQGRGGLGPALRRGGVRGVGEVEVQRPVQGAQSTQDFFLDGVHLLSRAVVVQTGPGNCHQSRLG